MVKPSLYLDFELIDIHPTQRSAENLEEIIPGVRDCVALTGQDGVERRDTGKFRL